MDVVLDFLRGNDDVIGQSPDFTSHDLEILAGFPGCRSFQLRVEGDDFGLVRDGVDDVQDFPDALDLTSSPFTSLIV